jgi:hypothetical protein
MPKLWNFTQFQLGWFALVLSAAQGRPLWGIATMLVLAAIHLRWFALRSEVFTLILVTGLGWLWESLFHLFGLIRFPGHPESALMAPLWMAMLWLNFATVLNHSLLWLSRNLLICTVFGAVGGPLAFWAGSQMGAAMLPGEHYSLLALSLAWGLLLPLTVQLAAQIRGGNWYGLKYSDPVFPLTRRCEGAKCQ